MPTTETNLHILAAAKQSAQGTPATVPSRRFKFVGGNAPATAVDTGSANWSDGTAFGGTTQFLNSVLGQGQPALEGGTDELAWLLWAFHGAETVTPSGTNAVQTLSVTGTPTGGTIPVTYAGRTTPVGIAFNSTSAAAQTILEALPNIGTGNILVGGGPLPATPLTLTFQGTLQKRPIALAVASSALLTGGTTPTATITTTTPGLNAKHSFAPTNSLGHWTTWWDPVGSQSAWKLKHNDGRIGGLQIEASSGTKDLRASPQVLFLDPGEVYTADPTWPAIPTSPVLIFTDGSGSFKIDGTVFRGLNQFNITLAYNLGPIYGDSTTPFDLARGTAAATITVTAIADDTMKQQYYTWLYGTPTPTAGQKPLSRVPGIGSFDFDLVNKDPADATVTRGRFAGTGTVQWQVPDAVAPNPDQGSAEISITGQLQPLGATPLYGFDVYCQSAAFTS